MHTHTYTLSFVECILHAEAEAICIWIKNTRSCFIRYTYTLLCGSCYCLLLNFHLHPLLHVCLPLLMVLNHSWVEIESGRAGCYIENEAGKIHLIFIKCLFYCVSHSITGVTFTVTYISANQTHITPWNVRARAHATQRRKVFYRIESNRIIIHIVQLVWLFLLHILHYITLNCSLFFPSKIVWHTLSKWCNS